MGVELIIIIPVALAIYYLTFLDLKKQAKRLDNYFIEFARLHHLEVIIDEDKWFRSFPVAKGEIDGRYFRLFMFGGDGNQQNAFTALELSCKNDTGGKLRLCRKDFLKKFDKKWSLKNVFLGDSFFDNKYLIQSNKPSFPFDLLDEDLKNQLIFIHPYLLGTVKVEKEHIYYEETITLNNDYKLAHLLNVTELLQAFAKRIEEC